MIGRLFSVAISVTRLCFKTKIVSRELTLQGIFCNSPRLDSLVYSFQAPPLMEGTCEMIIQAFPLRGGQKNKFHAVAFEQSLSYLTLAIPAIKLAQGVESNPNPAN